MKYKFKYTYNSSIGFNRFVNGIHYLIELLHSKGLHEPFVIQEILTHFSSVELANTIVSTSLTKSLVDNYSNLLLLKLEETINNIEIKDASSAKTENSSELEDLESRLDFAQNFEDEIFKLDKKIEAALQENNFLEANEYLNQRSEYKINDKFTIQTRIDDIKRTKYCIPDDIDLITLKATSNSLSNPNISLKEIIISSENSDSSYLNDIYIDGESDNLNSYISLNEFIAKMSMHNSLIDESIFINWLEYRGYIRIVQELPIKRIETTNLGEKIGILTLQPTDITLTTIIYFTSKSVSILVKEFKKAE